MNKSFSIIIACYNSENYLPTCLNSILNQDYDKNLLQIIIVDDGSKTNAIEKIVNQYKSKLPNINYFKKNNGNWPSVINYVLENKLIKNDYVYVLDSDDFIHKNCFKIVSNKIKNHDVFVGSCRKWNGRKKGQYFSAYYFPFKRVIKNKLSMQTPICLPMMFFYKKEIFYKIKKLTENIPHQDGDLTAQILANANDLIFSYNVIGYYYDVREGNTMTQKWDDRFPFEYKVCEKFLEYDLQELITFRLFQKDFRKLCIEKKIIFKINRKFSFKWIPWFYRIFYILIFKFQQKKLFTF